MNSIIIKSHLTYNDYDKIIGKILNKLDLEKEYYISNFTYNNPVGRFYWQILQLAQYKGKLKMGLEMSVIDYFKFKRGHRKNKTFYRLNKFNRKDKVDLKDFCHTIIKEMYPDKIPFGITYEIGTAYYMDNDIVTEEKDKNEV